MTLDDDLVEAVDKLVKELRTTRSAFTGEALRHALREFTAPELGRRHREGYKKRPARKGEFNVWEREQAWGDM